MTNRRHFMGWAVAGLAGSALQTQADAATKSSAHRYAVAPMPVPSLPIEGSALRFPIHRIYCMGINYQSHKDESSFKAPGPFYFQKSNDMIVDNNSKIAYPMLTKNFHHEIEMVVAIGKGGVNIAPENALEHVYGYALGLDMTRRDLQFDEVKHSLPWEAGKSFEQCAPCTAIHPAALVGDMSNAHIELAVNGEIRQTDTVANMILDVPHIIAFLSQSIELAPGDLIYTGTPAGVGPVVSGDKMVGKLDKVGELTITVA